GRRRCAVTHDVCMKLLFPLHGFVQWNGGVDFVRLLESALSAVEDQTGIEVTFAYPVPSRASRAFDRVRRGLRRWRAQDAGGNTASAQIRPVLLRSAIEIAARRHVVVPAADTRAGIARAARALECDIVFPAMSPPADTSIPAIGYIFDFQHK